MLLVRRPPPRLLEQLVAPTAKTPRTKSAQLEAAKNRDPRRVV
jgi:hypothetical protein